MGNPTREALETCLASLENGKYALMTSSGMSAVMLITHLLDAGDHIIAGDDLYGGTVTYFNKIVSKTYGIETTYVDMSDLDLLRESIQDNTKIVYIETPTNPLLK